MGVVEGESIGIPEEFRKLEQEKVKPRPYEVVAQAVGMSADRLRRLLNTGRVEGEKLRKKGKGFPWRWETSVWAVERYKDSKKTPREYGRMGGRPRKRRAQAVV